MTKSRKGFYWIGRILGGTLLLLCGLLLAAPFLINLDSVREKIEARFNRETGGKGAFKELDLHFFPRPHAVIREGQLSFPGSGTMVFKSLAVYPKLLPLLKGAFLPARIQLSSPRTDIDLSSAKKDKQAPALHSDVVGKWKIPPYIHAWINKTDGLEIQIENGLLNLSTPDPIFKNRASFQFRNINIRAEQAAGSLTLQLTCASNFFGHMDMKGQLETRSLKTKGVLALSDLKTGEFQGYPHNHKAMRLEDGLVDVQVEFEGMGLESRKAHVTISAPSLKLSRGQRRVILKGAQLEGDIQMGKGGLVASLSRMTLDDPRMALSGLFKKGKDDPGVSIHLEGEEVDIPAIRSCALELADDISAIKDIFAVIQDGYVPSIRVDAQGKSLADMGNLNHYNITGQMQRGKISIANPRLDLEEVAGSVHILNGVLRGRRLLAKMGKIKGKNGMLTVALTDNAAPFYLDIQVDADLAESHSVLKGLVKKGAFSEWLNHIRTIEGQATARLKLDETKGGIQVDVDCSSCRLQACYQSLPHPITVKKGGFHYQRNLIRLRELAGTYGRSEFLLASALFDWKNEPRMEIDSAKATVFLEQIYPLLSTMKLPGKWLEELNEIQGRLTFHSLAVKGPLKTPAQWQYQTDFGVENVFLNASFLPGPLTTIKARVQANTGGIRFSNAEIHILDADFNMAGRSLGPLTEIRKFETTLSGTLGSQGMQYLFKTLEMPQDFLLQTPLTIRSGHTLWEKSTGTSFNGKLLFPEGPAVALDVSYGPTRLTSKLTVEDNASRTTLGFLAHEELVDIAFSGKLRKSTLDRTFVKNPVLDGWIEGDISARILPRQSFSASVEGSLKGEGIPVYGVGLPATIEAFSLRAEGQQLRVDSARIALYENSLVISGSADLSTENTRFDMDISTDNVDLDKILAFLKESETDTASSDKAPWSFPIRGAAHLMWDSLKIGGYTWRPFQGKITVDTDSIQVSVENAKLCGIDSPGHLRIKRDGLEVAFGLKAEKGSLNQTMTCLTREQVDAEGTFDIAGNMEGNGKWHNLFERLKGPITYSSAGGQIIKDPALAGVISVLKVNAIFEGNLPTFEKDGLPYDSIQIKANLENGKIHIQEGLMNSSAMNLAFHGNLDLLNERIDLDMLASPFTLTDRLIQYIPVAGYIMGGTLISVPIKVDGPLKDPKVRILPLSEIGSGVWGIMKRTLKSPIKLVEPLVGEKEKPKEEENKSIFW